ncbi:uncharacterized protein PHACADRAFT_104211, partial [Phanerochaete carnosa HHB-10118-sp]
EFVGQVFVRHSVHSTTLGSASHFLWTADTGATSYMTPYKHWFHNYTPMRVAVHFANNRIIYSEDVESVVFAPEVKKKLVRKLEFSRMLHVPELGSNLFSVLYLVRHHSLNVHIYSDCMNFDHNGETLFCAFINTSNTAYFDGTVISAMDSAQVANSSALPLDE